MSKRDDLVPFDRHRAQKWTRASDYLPGADGQALPPPVPDLPRGRTGRVSRRGLWLPVYALGIAAAALWASGAFEAGGPAPGGQAAAAAAPAGTTSSRGIVFGLCDQGGGTNCVVDGDSFYVQGKAIHIAGIDAPDTHSASCDAEAVLGRAAAERLQSLLNSGTLTMSPAAPGYDENGRLLRRVRIDGADVAAAMAAAGLARPSGGTGEGWC